MLQAKNKNKRNQSLDREVKAKRADCEVQLREDRECNKSGIEMENCILKCMSNMCYGNIYAGDPLEEGEVDIIRGRNFRSCARNELRQLKVAEKQRLDKQKEEAKLKEREGGAAAEK